MNTNTHKNSSWFVPATLLVLFASLALNVLFFTGVFGQKHQTLDSDASDKNEFVSYSGQDRVLVEDIVNYGEAPSSLKPEKQAELQQLITAHIQSIPLPSDEYWKQSPAESRLHYRIQKLNAYDQIRSSLLSRYGESARTEPAFKEVFFPMYPYERYLSSQEQILIQRAHAEKRLALLESQKQPSQKDTSQTPKRFRFGDPALQAELQKYKENPLTRDLSSDTKYAYELRHDRTANLLRNSGFSFTESQFRRAFDELKAMTDAQSQFDFSLNPADSLRTLSRAMDIDAAFSIWADLDGTFSKILADSRSAGIEDQDIVQAYDIMHSAMRDFYDAELVKQSNPEEGNELLRQAFQDRQDRLIALVGDEATEKLTGAPLF